MGKVLEVEKLSKHYGNIKAVNKLNFEVEAGTVFGILGPNGSGKTTTLAMLCSIVNPLMGSYKWFGKLPDKNVRKNIGTLLETPNFYDYLSGEKNMEIVADIIGVDYSKIKDILELVGLYNRRSSKFKTYSLGMKQRLALGAALIGDPDVLILDEPTNGLDPQGIAEVRNLITEIANSGKTIILASHLLDEVQKVCTDVLVMKNGKKLYQGKVDQVLQSQFVIELDSSDKNKLKEVIKDADFVEEIKENKQYILATLKDDINVESVNKYLFERNVILSHLNIKKQNLEEQILQILNK